MRTLLKTKMLWISTCDISFGDFMTNSLITNTMMNLFDYELQMHYYINELTMERSNWFINYQNISDRTFIHHNNRSFNKDKFVHFPIDYYDYILIDHVGYNIEEILNSFRPKEFLDVRGTTHLKQAYSYFNISNPYENINPYNLNKLRNKIKILTENKNYIMLFPFSTRSLASLNLNGIIKINEFALKHDCLLLICGENFSPYSFENKMSFDITKFLKECDSDNIINLLGLSNNKTISLAKDAKYVFYTPSGMSMLGILNIIDNNNSYLLSGGDSSIMWDIQKVLKGKHFFEIHPNCKYYPCGKFADNIPEQVLNCRINKEAKCLNDDLNIGII